MAATPGAPIAPPRFLLITSMKDVPEGALVERVRAAAALPVEARAAVAVQLRDPELSGRALYELGARLRRVTRDLGVGLLINDRLDLALALGADGVHLGRRSVSVVDARAALGPGAFISVACHAVSEVVAAASGAGPSAAADAALLSPIFASPGKGAPLGVEALGEARAGLRREGRHIHLIALGGVSAMTAGACFAAGADGVAAIREDLVSIAVSTLAGDLAT